MKMVLGLNSDRHEYFKNQTNLSGFLKLLKPLIQVFLISRSFNLSMNG